MLVACWSSKGGAGTTVVAAALALLLAAPRRRRRAARRPGRRRARRPRPAPSPTGPGLAGWLAAGADVPRRRARPARGARRPRASRLLARGPGPLADRRGPRCSPRCSPPTPGRVVVDCGTDAARRAPLARRRRRHPVAARHPAVLPRRCAGRVARPLRPPGSCCVDRAEPALTRARRRGRARRAGGRRGRVDPAVARAVDAGLLATRLPRTPGPGAPRVPPDGASRRSSTPCTPRCSAPTPTAVGDRRGRGRRRPARPPAARPTTTSARVADAVAARAAGLGPARAAARRPRRHRGDGERPRARVGRARAAASSAPTLVLDRREVELLVERIVGPLGLRADRTLPGRRRPPRPTARGSTSSSPPLAVDGPCITIRRFGARPHPARGRCARPGVAELLGLGRARPAPTSSSAAAPAPGKTTLLNALGAAAARRASGSSPSRTPPSCACPGDHVVRLEARPATADGRRRGRHPRPRAQRAAHAARPHRRRRGPGRGGLDML